MYCLTLMTLLKHSTSYVTHWPSWYLMQNSMKVPQPQHKLIYSVLVVDNLAIKIRLRDSAIRAGEDRVTIHFAIVTHATKMKITMWSIPGLVSHERFFCNHRTWRFWCPLSCHVLISTTTPTGLCCHRLDGLSRSYSECKSCKFHSGITASPHEILYRLPYLNMWAA